MTTITIDRAVVEQALEVLESCQDGDYTTGDVRQSFDEQAVNAAIVALWAALAQDKQQAEPVEPVAWMLTDAQNPRVRFLEWQKETRAYSGDWIKTPLYTAPPQRKPLTEEEIERLWYPSTVIAEPGKRRVAFGRAVERAHGIEEKK